MNPHFATGAKDLDGARLFYESLARYDADANLVPVLAAEIPSRDNGGIAADGRSTTWKLKKGVKWHDGRPFTADDVIFNWAYATDPATAAFSLGSYEGIKAVTKVDAETVRFEFDKPTPVWARTATVQLMPKHLFEAFAGAKSRDAPANLKPVGTGPVSLRRVPARRPRPRRDQHRTITLPNRPHFDSVELKGGGDATSSARAVLQTGEYDFGWNLQVEDEVLKRMETAGKGRAVAYPSGNIEFIQLNMADPASEAEGEKPNPKSRNPILSDKAVREALALLFDRKSVQEFLYGRAGVATANYLNNPTRYNSPNIKDEFSVDKANARARRRRLEARRRRHPREERQEAQAAVPDLDQLGAPEGTGHLQAVVRQGRHRARAEGRDGVGVLLVRRRQPRHLRPLPADLQMYAGAGRLPDPDSFMQWMVSWQASTKANKWQGLNRGRWASDDYDTAYRASEASSIRSGARRS